MADKKILVWDSSGTMTNSLPERFIICADAYLQVHPGTDLQVTPGNKIVTASEYAAKIGEMQQQYARFERLNPFVQKGKDGYAILEAMRRGIDGQIETEAQFKAFKKTLDEGTQDAFYEAFQNIRRDMKKNDTQAWYGLQPAFPGVPETVRQMHEAGLWDGQYVLTAKEAALVATLVDGYGIGDIIPNAMVRDTIDTKANTLGVIAAERGRTIGDIVFVEDSMPNLKPCYEAGAKSVLAGWGYTNQIQLGEAAQLSIPIARDAPHLVQILTSMAK